MKRYVQSLQRGMDILFLLSENQNGLGVGEIAEFLNIASSSTHTLLGTLIMKRLARQVGKKYFLGEGISILFGSYVNSAYMESVKLIMKDISTKIPGAVIVFAEKEFNEISIRFRVSPDRPGILQTPVNRRISFYFSISSTIIVAFSLEEIQQELFLIHPFDEEGPGIWKDFKTFQKAVEAAKINGFSESIHAGNQIVAFPVLQDKAGFCGVLSVRVFDKGGKTNWKNKLFEVLEPKLKSGHIQI